ncbi:MAG: hypothetical protein E7474_08950 [Ruminococcaceae bacterium]|nr:hypothetical protein [Oscillospiraceae bacterium]
MDGMSEYGNINLASSAQYAYSVMNMTMRSEVTSEKGLLEMLPEKQQFQVRGPQPGDVPAVMKGNFFDTYA